ncbi:MAG: riboflavin synthase [Candidatus Electryoneaceae bacterium]|nr:riboflavin synthase [Candidatus Electryoneaceae bacterium]
MIEEIGTIATKTVRSGNLLLTIKAKTGLEGLKLGDSIAVSGPCLTVTDVGRDSFQVEATTYTVDQSTLKTWNVGGKVNLERALRVSDRLVGHFVQGHVDGIGKVSRISYRGGSTHIYFDVSASILKLIAPKGSVAIDGISLTLAEKTVRGFMIMVIPFTLESTTLGDLKPGNQVNIETDLIIRWLADRFQDGEVTLGNDLLTTGDEINYHTED